MSDIEPTIDDDLATVASWTLGGVSLVNRQDVSVRLAAEVVRLRMEHALLPGDDVLGAAAKEIQRLQAECAKLTAAIPEIIGCPDGNAACTRDHLGRFSCRHAHLVLVRLGLIPESKQAAEPEGGA